MNLQAMRNQMRNHDDNKRWYVFDFDTGQVARKADGTLAYFATRNEAREFVWEQQVTA